MAMPSPSTQAPIRRSDGVYRASYSIPYSGLMGRAAGHIVVVHTGGEVLAMDALRPNRVTGEPILWRAEVVTIDPMLVGRSYPQLRQVANPITGNLAKPEESLVVVAEKARVHLDREDSAMLFQEAVLRTPVAGSNAPLIVEDVTKLVGPGTGDPVGVLGACGITRAAREPVYRGLRHDPVAMEGFRKEDGVLKGLMVLLRDICVGV